MTIPILDALDFDLPSLPSSAPAGGFCVVNNIAYVGDGTTWKAVATSVGAMVQARNTKLAAGATSVDFDDLDPAQAQQFIITVRGAYDGNVASGTNIFVLPNKATPTVSEYHIHQTYNNSGTAGSAATHDVAVGSGIPVGRTFGGTVRHSVTGRLVIDAVVTAQGQRTFHGTHACRREAGNYQHLGGIINGWWEGGSNITSLRINFQSAFTGSVTVEAVSGAGVGGTNPARRIKGRVNADGTIASGTGLFTVSKPSAGVYNITLTTAFATVPNIEITSRGVNSTRVGIHYNETASSFTVGMVQANTGTNTDTGFDFTAEDPGLGLEATMDVEATRVVGAAGQPAPITAVTAFGSGMRFYKDPAGEVHLYVALTSPAGGLAAGAALFDMPDGYRPPFEVGSADEYYGASGNRITVDGPGATHGRVRVPQAIAAGQSRIWSNFHYRAAA